MANLALPHPALRFVFALSGTVLIHVRCHNQVMRKCLAKLPALVPDKRQAICLMGLYLSEVTILTKLQRFASRKSRSLISALQPIYFDLL